MYQCYKLLDVTVDYNYCILVSPASSWWSDKCTVYVLMDTDT
jgi:hypothetical protein